MFRNIDLEPQETLMKTITVHGILVSQELSPGSALRHFADQQCEGPSAPTRSNEQRVEFLYQALGRLIEVCDLEEDDIRYVVGARNWR